MNQVAELFLRQLRQEALEAPGRLAPAGRRERRLEAALSIGDLRELARRSVPRVVFDFADGGAMDEVTLRANASDFNELRLLPRVLVGVESLDMSTTVLGQPVAQPILGAPTGLTGIVNHEGELGIAQAVQAAGSIYVLSAMASYSMEEVAAEVSDPFWFQLYGWRDQGFVRSLIERASAVGCPALVLTVDVPVSGRRERDLRNGFGIPPRLTARSAIQGARHPRWTKDFFFRPRIAVAHASGAAGGEDAVSLLEYLDKQFNRALQWTDLDWIREVWEGPLVVKGLLHPDDVEQAVRLGADAVIVSNHGGRQLDSASSSVMALPRAIEAAGDGCEVYLDGGIRRGADVIKALALGARACLVGRPLVYGLAAEGRAGAEKAMAILISELERTMALCGCRDVAGIDSGLLAP